MDQLADQLARSDTGREDFRDEMRLLISSVVTGQNTMNGHITTIDGRVKNIEAKILMYDKLRDRIVGGIAAGTVSVAAIWFLIQDKIKLIFGIGPHT